MARCGAVGTGFTIRFKSLFGIGRGHRTSAQPTNGVSSARGNAWTLIARFWALGRRRPKTLFFAFLFEHREKKLRVAGTKDRV